MAEYSPEPPNSSAKKGTLEGRYTQLETDREPFLRRARTASSLTLPSLIVPKGFSPQSDLATPFQSVGARGVNNLAAKLLLALFPPNAPFFKFKVDPYALAKIKGLTENAEQEIEQNLLKAEEAVQGEIETKALRPYLHECSKHLVVAGNALLFLGDKESRPVVFHLPNYVVRRCNDIVEEIITLEHVDADDLPPSVREQLRQTPDANATRPTPVCLYTGCMLEGEKWYVWQEAGGIKLPDSDVSYTEDTFPYVTLRGEVVSGEDYGRGHVEAYMGDLQTLEGLSQAIVEGSAAAAAGRFLVNPNGLTDERDITSKPNWAFVPGRAEDVTVLQLGKYGDFQVAGNTAKGIEERLAFAFLLNTAIQRNAERVTAEEVRYMAQELEQGLGGLYSLLSHEFQLPLVTVLTARMTREKRLPKLPKDIVRPSIVTGIEALGRGNDLSRLSQAAAVTTAALGPAAASVYKAGAYALRVHNAAGVRAEDFIKSQQDLDQEAQQAQMAALAQKAAPNVVNAMSAAAQPQAQGAQ